MRTRNECVGTAMLTNVFAKSATENNSVSGGTETGLYVDLEHLEHMLKL